MLGKSQKLTLFKCRIKVCGRLAGYAVVKIDLLKLLSSFYFALHLSWSLRSCWGSWHLLARTCCGLAKVLRQCKMSCQSYAVEVIYFPPKLSQRFKAHCIHVLFSASWEKFPDSKNGNITYHKQCHKPSYITSAWTWIQILLASP